MLHIEAYAAAAFIFVFYHVANYAMQVLFYYRRRDDERAWKAQPGVAPCASERDWVPWLPLLEPFGFVKPGAPRYPLGWLLATVNICIGSAAAGVTAELVMRNASRLQFDEFEWRRDVLGIVWACTIEQIVEYFWHRAMHTAWLYSHLHRIHHANRAPSPFDDMLIHPLEGFGYYCILYSPAFLVNMHYSGFFVYMSIMGLCGVIDHCGVSLSVPGLYDSVDHDNHHKLNIVNYAFPFPFMDILFGTYDGHFLGREFKPWARAGLVVPKSIKE